MARTFRGGQDKRTAEKGRQDRNPLTPLDPTDLAKLLKDDLVALAEGRGIDSSGTKKDIIARLTSE